MISLLSERLHYYETRMQDITLKGVPARLASLILFLIESEGVQIPGEIRIPTRYSHEHLGTMIGANREAVTRAFGRLQDEGALQIRRRLIYVDDVEALERAAGRLLEEEEEQRAPSRRLLCSAFPGRLAAPEHIQILIRSVPGRRCLSPLNLKEPYDIFPLSAGLLPCSTALCGTKSHPSTLSALLAWPPGRASRTERVHRLSPWRPSGMGLHRTSG